MFLRILLSLAILSGLSACAIPDTARSGLRPLDDKTALLAFNGGPFEGSVRERMMFADPSQREEYGLFKSDAGIAEVVYLTTRHYHVNTLSLNSWVTLDKMINSWNYTRGDAQPAEDAYFFEAGWVGMWVKPFALGSHRQSCAGFSAEWDHPGADPNFRPSKKLFGYVCANPGATLSRSDLDKRLMEVGVRGINIRHDGETIEIGALPKTPSQTELRSLVQQGSFGTPDFPFIIAHIFSRETGCGTALDCP
jgi:hypothetical protein